MQRRSAAVSAAALLLIAAGAFVFIGFAQAPAVDVDAAATLSNGSETTIDGTTYTATDVWDGSATITWRNESARYTAELANNTTVAAAWVIWDGQTNRRSSSLAADAEIEYNGTTYRVEIGGETPRSFTLLQTTGNDTQEFGVGDTLRYQQTGWTVYQVTSEEVVLATGDPYRLLVDPGSDPTTFTFRQDINVTRVLVNDPDVENRVLRGNGQKYVRYTDGSTEPLDSYLPDPETEEFEQSGQLVYRANSTTIATVESDEVLLVWHGPKTMSTDAAMGSNVTLSGERYIAHYPDKTTLVLTQAYDQYEREQNRVDYYHERIAGLWGVSILSTLTAIILLGTALLPSRY